jgi:hypothetical protein
MTCFGHTGASLSTYDALHKLLHCTVALHGPYMKEAHYLNQSLVLSKNYVQNVINCSVS